MQRRFSLGDIYSYARNRLSDRFPDLPSYPAFANRPNRTAGVFPPLTERILSDFSGTDMMRHVRLIGSFPVVMANGKRSSRAEAADESADKGYCSSKGIRYYGVKAHILGIGRPGTLPVPDYVGAAPAGGHDLNAFRRIVPYLENCEVYADTAYIGELEKQLLREQGSGIRTPVKKRTAAARTF